jgi:TRAP-type C4-dicarboxylate transport system permease large subunit
METIETTAVVLLIVAGASIFGWIVTTTRITDEVAGLGALDHHRALGGAALGERLPADRRLLPGNGGGHHHPGAVLLPLMAAIGVDPVHFGLIMVLNLMIGLLTPPVGMVLYILARVSGLSFEQTTRACAPFLVPLFLCLALVTYWEGMVMWLPTLIYR